MYICSLDPQSNRATWRQEIQLTDVDTGETIKVDDCDVTITVRDESGRQVLSGSSDGGEIIFSEEDMFQWTFSNSQMAALCAGTYNVGVRISQNGIVMQLIIGSVPILEGIDCQ
jgi:hypothetical protein